MLKKVETKKRTLIICIVILSIIVVGYQLFKGKDINQNEYVVHEELIETKTSKEDIAEEELEQAIYVDVKGEIYREGVYEVKVGQRVKDVIELAGGFTEDADTLQVNLAQLLTDEMIIYVPAIGEVENIPLESSTDGKISLNKATIDEFITLPGIGPAKAQAIISYREEHGEFKKIEDILQISGIGEKTFEQIKDNLKLN